MCVYKKCCCEECQQEKLIDMIKQKDNKDIYEKERIDFIASNISIIIDLVHRFEEVIKKDNLTLNDAIKNQEYCNSLARNIARYIR